MFIEPWMVVAIILTFGGCAYLSFSAGRRDGLSEGVLKGIDGAFDYLEKHGVISILKDGSIKGAKGKIPATAIMDS